MAFRIPRLPGKRLLDGITQAALAAGGTMAGNVKYNVTHKPVWRNPGDPPFLSRENFSRSATEVAGVEPIRQFLAKPGVATGVLAAAALPITGGTGHALKGAALEDAVRAGAVAGGKVTVSKMSPAAIARAASERQTKAGINTADIVRQHGADGLLFKEGQKGAENLLAIAKHPGHSNTTFFQAGSDVFGRPVTPAMEKALMNGPEGSRAAYIVDQQGRITVGGPGTHHEQLMRHKDVKSFKDVLQGEIHFAQPEHDIPARLYTGRSNQFPGGGGWEVPGMGTGKPNHLQTAALEDWMNKANGVGGYTPRSGQPVIPSGKVSMGKTAEEGADIARARVLRRKLAGEPNPLGKETPSALEIAGRTNHNERNAGMQLRGAPMLPKNYETKRVWFGVKPGGMGHGATGPRRPSARAGD